MRCFSLSIFLLFLLSCATVQKPDYQSVSSQTQKSEKILDNLRDLAQASAAVTQENFQFISEKLKDSISQYKVLKSEVSKLEETVKALSLQQKKLQEKEDKKIKLESVTLDMDDSLIDNLEEENFDAEVAESSITSASSTTSTSSSPVASSAEEMRTTSSAKTKFVLSQAKNFYKEKNWESAIAKFEEYRRLKSKNSIDYLKATLYIGRSFKNLKLNQEAEVFFNEIIKNSPHSKEAKEAKALLK